MRSSKTSRKLVFFIVGHTFTWLLGISIGIHMSWYKTPQAAASYWLSVFPIIIFLAMVGTFISAIDYILEREKIE